MSLISKHLVIKTNMRIKRFLNRVYRLICLGEVLTIISNQTGGILIYFMSVEIMFWKILAKLGIFFFKVLNLQFAVLSIRNALQMFPNGFYDILTVRVIFLMRYYYCFHGVYKWNIGLKWVNFVC